jgi:hypothetical protein
MTTDNFTMAVLSGLVAGVSAGLVVLVAGFVASGTRGWRDRRRSTSHVHRVT